MQNWSTTLVGDPRTRKKITPLQFIKQVVTPEDSTGAGDSLYLGITASVTKVTLCVAAAFSFYAMIAQLH